MCLMGTDTGSCRVTLTVSNPNSPQDQSRASADTTALDDQSLATVSSPSAPLMVVAAGSMALVQLIQ